MQKNSAVDVCSSFVCRNTCTLDLLDTTAKSQHSSSLVKVVMHVLMNSLLSRPKASLVLPLWTPFLTRPFSLYHAHQRTLQAMEKERIRKNSVYKRRKEYFDKNPEAIQQPSDFYWQNSRYSNDATWRAERREWRRAYYARNEKNNEACLMRIKLRDWVTRLPWMRKELPWKAYRPIVYDQLTAHYCVGCKWTRPGGRKVYWQSVVDATEFLCTKCYIPLENPDWNWIMPEGYEDVRDAKTLRARKEQLDASKPPSS